MFISLPSLFRLDLVVSNIPVPMCYAGSLQFICYYHIHSCSVRQLTKCWEPELGQTELGHFGTFFQKAFDFFGPTTLATSGILVSPLGIEFACSAVELRVG